MSFSGSIRRAAPQDLDAVLALDAAAPEIAHWPAREYAAALDPVPDSPAAGPIRCLFVAEENSVLGFILLKLAAGDAEIENLAVAPAARRRGLGRALLHHAIAHARDSRAEHLLLEVRAGNHPARSLYTMFGFIESGRRPNYYSAPVEDAILLDLAL